MTLTLACAAPARGQFTTGVDVVEVYATVTDGRGRPITGMGRDDFVVREDGVERPIAIFSAGDFALSVALALDRSFSMAGERLAVARSAAHTFLGELAAGDEAMIIAISNEIETIAPLSTYRAAQHAAVSGLRPWGTTSLHDAIVEAFDRIDAATGRRALVVLSDGSDRYSEHDEEAVLQRARHGDVLVYPVALGAGSVPLFERLAAATGGQSFHVRNPSQLAAVFRGIAGELRRQYLLGYEPQPRASADQGRWRAIDVEVRRPAGATVRARPGYFVR